MIEPPVMGGRPLPEQTAERIREYVRDNELKPGTKLPNEFQLAQLCGVGRSTIREAIKLLVFEGLVEVVRGNGTFLLEQKEKAPDDPMGLRPTGRHSDSELGKKALQFLEVRLMVEPEIASMAAANADYEDCRRLRELKEEVERCIRAGKDHLQADIQFHTQIAKCSKNEVVYKLMEIIVTGIPVFIKVTKNSLTDATIQYHSEITESICNGDAVGARCSMIGHLNHNRKAIISEAREREE